MEEEDLRGREEDEDRREREALSVSQGPGLADSNPRPTLLFLKLVTTDNFFPIFVAFFQFSTKCPDKYKRRRNDE